jgi:hypothetical protein
MRGPKKSGEGCGALYLTPRSRSIRIRDAPPKEAKMSGSAADLDAAIARLNKAMGALETRVGDLKLKADSAPADDDLFARPDSGRERELELAAANASAALDKAAAEIRAVLEEA